MANLRQKIYPSKLRRPVWAIMIKFAASQAVLSLRLFGEESPGNTGRHAS